MNPTNELNKAANYLPTDEESTRILRERAEQIAKKKIDKIDKSKNIDYIKFRLGDKECYGVPFDQIKEVIDHVEVTSIPRAHEYVLGVVNRRGSLITIIDLKKIFSIQDNHSNAAKSQAIMIVESNEVVLGLLADEIEGSDTFDGSAMNSLFPYEGVVNAKYMIGLHQHTISILNISMLVSDLCQIISHKE